MFFIAPYEEYIEKFTISGVGRLIYKPWLDIFFKFQKCFKWDKNILKVDLINKNIS